MVHTEADAPLLRLLALAGRRMGDELQARLVAAGFDDHRAAHHNVMPHVPDEGIRLTELAERARMTKQAMAELVVDLERLGYLERRADPTDARAKLIVFSDRGRKAVAAALGAFREMEADLGERIGSTAMRSLRRSLLAIIDEAR